MLENLKESRKSKHYELLQKKYDKLSIAYDKMKEEKAALERDLVVCRAKLDRTGNYEAELRETLAQARDAKRSYDAAYMDLQIIRKQYAEQVNALLSEIKKQGI